MDIIVEHEGFSGRFTTGPVTIGRAATCDVRVDDPRVSRLHVELDATPDGGWRLTDRSSAGTWSDGQRLEGSVIVRNSVVFTLAATDGPEVRLRPEIAAPILGDDPVSPSSVVTGTSMWAAVRERPLLVVGCGLGAAIVAALLHIWIVATKYGNSVSAGPWEIVPMSGNRFWGTIFILLFSVLVGVLLASLRLRGLAGTGRWISSMGDGVRTGYRAAAADGRRIVWIAAAVAVLLWMLIVRGGFFLIESYQPDLSPAWSLLLGAFAYLGASAAFGGRSAVALGRMLGRVRPAGAGERQAGSLALLGLAIGFAIPFVVRLDLMLWVIVIGCLWSALRGQRPPAAATAVLFGVAMFVGGADQADADDGGWVECGSSIQGYIGCDGSDEVIYDSGYAVPAGAVGGAAGAALGAASALGGRREDDET